MNAVEYFRRRLTQLPTAKVIELREIEVVGPHPFLAAVTTSKLHDMVEAELVRRVDSHLTAA